MKVLTQNMLPELSGHIVKLDGSDFKKMGDLLYFDGPLMSHLMNNKKENYLIIWSGQDSVYNRWMLYKTDYELLGHYFNGTISELEIITQNPDGFVYFVDINKDIKWEKAVKMPVLEIPENYLPEKDVYYNSGDFGTYGLELENKVKAFLKHNNTAYKISPTTVATLNEPPSPPYVQKK